MRNLEIDSRVLNRVINYERWRVADDSNVMLIGLYTGEGSTMHYFGRTDGVNADHEVNTDDQVYSGIVTTIGLPGSLFSSGTGVKYVGRDSHLYQYNTENGYYYYDSSKNAASYNRNAQRFYVYPYTVKTDKAGSTSDFLPFNYGASGAVFTEAWGAPNYWFGMKSQINFFLPNATGYKDANNQYGNLSTKGDEMVYKFSGDDDVWVFVDGQLVLNMGGIHGQVYGEINFSRGTWTIAQGGAEKATVGGVISYTPGTGTINSGTFSLPEGDHTLTLYYMERGSPQSNCAIYFNLAPRYSLQFRKVDSTTNNTLNGARFGVYTDPGCTLAANVWRTDTGTRTNEFTTGDSGYGCSGLVAGKTYYIKELAAPAGYVKPEGPYIFTVAANGTTTLDSTVAHTMVNQDGNTFTIENEPGVELPATGGPGTAVCTVSGLSVMAAALWLIMLRRRAD